MSSISRVLWLCKSRYMRHDVIDDRYARLFELPHRLGNCAEVSAFCLDYSLKKPAPIDPELQASWRRSSVPRTLFFGWLLVLLAHARKFRPQCVIASSDCLHIILGSFIARIFGAVFYADLYDDYLSFGLAKVPGVRWLYTRALARADGICTVSKTLGQDMQQQYPGTPVLVLESTIDTGLFYPRDKMESREILGLECSPSARLVGICGGLNVLHGADIAFKAFEEIATQDSEVQFVVAGTLDEGCPLPRGINLNYVGMLPHTQMPDFYSAMDVVLVPLSNTRFGYYAFPQKAYEILACNVAVAAADVGAMGLLFAATKEVLYCPESASSLAATVTRQLQDVRKPAIDIPTWNTQAERLERFIQGGEAA